MRIELLQHAVDRAVDEAILRQLLDVLFRDRVERRREDLVLLRDLVLPGQQTAAERAASDGREDNREDGYGEEPGTAHEGIVTDQVS